MKKLLGLLLAGAVMMSSPCMAIVGTALLDDMGITHSYAPLVAARHTSESEQDKIDNADWWLRASIVACAGAGIGLSCVVLVLLRQNTIMRASMVEVLAANNKLAADNGQLLTTITNLADRVTRLFGTVNNLDGQYNQMFGDIRRIAAAHNATVAGIPTTIAINGQIPR